MDMGPLPTLTEYPSVIDGARVPAGANPQITGVGAQGLSARRTLIEECMKSEDVIARNRLLYLAKVALGIDRPIYGTRIKGSQMEIYLYGGEVVEFPLSGVIEEELGQMSKKQLMVRARLAGLTGCSTMRKSDLLARLQQLDQGESDGSDRANGSSRD